MQVCNLTMHLLSCLVRICLHTPCVPDRTQEDSQVGRYQIQQEQGLE
jgi:hypothetical protein